MIELIDIQAKKFRVKNTILTLAKASIYKDNELIPLPPKLKGSTLGWNVAGKFISYKKLKTIYENARIYKATTTSY